MPSPTRISSTIRTSIIAVGISIVSLFQASARPVDPDIPRLQANAERGSIKEEVLLGAAYFVGRGVTQDERLAAYWYEKAANAGDPGAQNQIGYLYQVGLGVPRDPVRAVHWYERAVAGGFTYAKVNLAIAYLWGTGAHQDTELAMRLLQEAVEKGNGLGACYLGDIYQMGVGVPKNEDTARHWYEIGAKLRDPRAQFKLGLLLSRDQYPSADLNRAAKLMRDSANAGLVPAKHQLALLLVRRPELAISPGEVTSLLTESASAGFWKSSVLLGILARDGKMMPADLKTAYYHFRVATLQGGAEANQLVANDLKRLETNLNAAQTEEISRRAAEWFQKHRLSLTFIFPSGDSAKQFPAYALESPEKDMHAGRLIATPSL